MQLKEKNLVPKFKKALSVIGESTVREVCEWLDKKYPRVDDRTWKNNMVILGDYAVYKNGDRVSGVYNTPRFIVKTTQRNEKPAKFRLK
ncbi:MAG: hypothetical protein NTU57_02080 [Candidatus Aenigmarchaeota archaeon]|nr:hypothetical protein [Candidatus Aenigmarchaeota archaeon]